MGRTEGTVKPVKLETNPALRREADAVTATLCDAAEAAIIAAEGRGA